MDKEKTDFEKVMEIIRNVSRDDGSRKAKKKKRKSVETDIDIFATDEES